MEKELTPQESLDIIKSMVVSGRKRIKDDGSIYMLWGVSVTLAALFEYVWIHLHGFDSAHYAGWMVLMPLSGIATGILVARMKKEAKVHTHFDEAMSYLWPAVGAMLIVVLLLAGLGKLSWTMAYPIVIGLYGTATFVSGGLLNFKLMQVGASLCWLLALWSAFVGFEQQLLLLVAAIWVSYMIPGILLNRKASSSHV
jgi:hypothetical protein